MVTTEMLLDLLKEKLGSDYKTAKALGISSQRVSYIRIKGGVFTDAQGLKAAEILDFPAYTILLSLAAERSLNSPVFGDLKAIADQFDPRKTAAVVLIATAFAFEISNNFHFLPIA